MTLDEEMREHKLSCLLLFILLSWFNIYTSHMTSTISNIDTIGAFDLGLGGKRI